MNILFNDYSYYEVGKLLIEAQGGEERAKYRNKLIKEYSERLTKELGKGYDVSNLKRMRQFYLTFSRGVALPHQLSWSHIIPLLTLENIDEIKYYIYIAKKAAPPINGGTAFTKYNIPFFENMSINFKNPLNKFQKNTSILFGG